MANDLVRYEDQGGEVTFTSEEVKRQLCPQLEDSELAYVMALCQAQKLNPFMKDVYIQKFENHRDGGYYPASIITSKEVFTKRAQANPKFEGMEAGVTFLTQDGKIVQREGSMPINGWQLIGGWCKVYVKGYRVPIYDEVALSEYNTGKNNWQKMPGTMIRKVALCHALREAFPDDFQGLYGAEEMDKAVAVHESSNGTSDGAKTALESNIVAEAEFVEIVSDAQAEEYVEWCNDFAELCDKSFDDVHAAVLNSKAMKELGVGEDWTHWTHNQMMNALHQLGVWIEKVKADKQDDQELADEDIEF